MSRSGLCFPSRTQRNSEALAETVNSLQYCPVIVWQHLIGNSAR